MGCGLAFEALNNAGHTERNLIVVLNDNRPFDRAQRGGDEQVFDRRHDESGLQPHSR